MTAVDLAQYAQIRLSTPIDAPLNKTIAAIGVRVKGNLAQEDAVAPVWALLRGLFARKASRRYVQVSLTATDPPAAATDFLAPTAYAKLLDVNIAMPRVEHEHIGEATESMALQRANQIMQAMLDTAAVRGFTVSANIPTALAEEGDTVSVAAVLYRLEDWGLSLDNDGLETLDLAVIDETNTDLF